MRQVVILCGPPGAGKTTAARASGLPVFDRDDDQWTSEKQFRDALRALAVLPGARAVIIRSGATSNARRTAAELAAATHTFLLLADRDELKRRVRHRDRPGVAGTLRGIDRWFASFDRRDQVPDFPGWPALAEPTPTLGATSTDW
ncbi:ATP-binding protein [Microbacterium halophytorum]|uniref:hypothetical protein n=1 Tax=Microbacterium halophytorum TaxID=2067568 RepID=UPI000CFBCC05|nr:hypothetical protein [Microbacterium halophytorum]